MTISAVGVAVCVGGAVVASKRTASVGVGDAVTVRVRVGVAVALGDVVCVGVMVGVMVSVAVKVGVMVNVTVGLGEAVYVKVGVTVGVAVTVGVTVELGCSAMMVGLGVAVGARVRVGARVGVSGMPSVRLQASAAQLSASMSALRLTRSDILRRALRIWVFHHDLRLDLRQKLFIESQTLCAKTASCRRDERAIPLMGAL